MTLEEIEAKIGELFSPNSQRYNEAMAAFSGFKSALSNLARHGLTFTIEQGLMGGEDEFPKALVHPTHGHLTVDDEVAEAEARKAGYTMVEDPSPTQPGPPEEPLPSEEVLPLEPAASVEETWKNLPQNPPEMPALTEGQAEGESK